MLGPQPLEHPLRRVALLVVDLAITLQPADLRQACVTPHIAQKSRHSAIDGRGIAFEDLR